jgi:tetratricopeptide (TPR) repeat protein
VTVLLAAFFGTFLLFLALGLLALVVTAALDRSLGKERALLAYAIAVVAIAWLLRPQAAPLTKDRKPKDLRLEAAVDPAAPLEFRGDLFARPKLPSLDRNPFREHSDTSPLPPVDLDRPPDVPLAFPLPPTVPGVAPPARRLYRGSLPAVATGDGTKIPAIPVDGFSTYVPKPEDVFDWILSGDKRFYVYIVAIDGVREGQPGFDGPKGLKWNLALSEGPPNFDKDWRELQVTYASIGPEDAAQKLVDDPAKARKRNVTTMRAGEKDRWFLRRTVDNIFFERLREKGNPNPEKLASEQLREVAVEMARVGETGKEDGAGHQRAVTLLEIALKQARERPGADALTSDLLAALVDAQRALHDERALLASLAAYVRQNPRRGDGLAGIGEVMVHGLFLPEGALAFLDRAIEVDANARAAHLARGDALTLLDDHAGALKAYGAASQSRAGPDASTSEAEAYLRLGRLADARRAADQALAAEAYNPRALLVKGAAQYAAGEVEGARDTFAQAATLPGEGAAGLPARRHRAEALFDLGLAEWRLGHGDAAREAFDAAEAALRSGSRRGRSGDEAVSPELGRALLSLSAGNGAEAAEALERARLEGPGISYIEMLSGVIALGRAVPVARPAPAPGTSESAPAPAAPTPVDVDAPAARRAFERALVLEPALFELDGWLAEARVAIAEAASAAGVPPAESAADFGAAIRFASRATARERSADPRNPDFLVREAGIRLRALHVSERRRFEEARTAADAVLQTIAREDRRALAIKGYANFRLGPYEGDLYDESIRNLQGVLDASPTDDPLKRYATETLERVKKWQSLELKVVGFNETKLSTEWEQDESKGVRGSPDQGRLRFWDSDRSKGAAQDGSMDEPLVRVRSEKMFDKQSFERLSVKLWLPKTDRQGQTVNNVTFGVQVQAPSKEKGLSKVAGIGLFYDKGKVAVRAGGSTEVAYRDGLVHRLTKDGQEVDWPDVEPGKAVVVEIEREDPKEGWLVVRLYPEGREDPRTGMLRDEDKKAFEVFRQKFASFRQAKSPAEVWFGGYSTKSQNWDLALDDLRIVRRR